MPFVASAVRFGFTKPRPAIPLTPASVTFVAMGTQFGMFDVAPVAGATSYTVNIYSNTARSTTGGTLSRTVTSPTNSSILDISFGGNGAIYTGSPSNFYYLVATATNSLGTSSPRVSTQIATFFGYTGSTTNWVSPTTGAVTVSVTGGGATDGPAGNGGMMVCSYGVTSGSTYAVTVGQGAQDNGGAAGAFSAGGVTGGTGLYNGGGMTQFHTVMYAGGGGAGGYPTYNGGGSPQGGFSLGGNGGTLGLNGSGGVGGDGEVNTSSTGNLGGIGRGATQSANGAGGIAGGTGATAGLAGSGTAGQGQGGNGGSGSGSYSTGGGGGAGYFGGGGSGGIGSGGGACGGGGGGSSFAGTGTTVLNVINFASNAYPEVDGGGAAPYNGMYPGLAFGQPAGDGACVIWW